MHAQHPILSSTCFIAALIMSSAACTDPTTAVARVKPTGPTEAVAAVLYKVRLIVGVNPAGDGEVQSAWFPDAGIQLNTRAPFKSLSLAGATIDLVNYTHGAWTAGTCATFSTSKSINITNWDVTGSSPALTFAGTWRGTLTTSQTTGTSVSFDGDRLVNGVVTPSAGGIHNVVSNGNAAIETKDPTGNNDWFRLEIRNAALKFGSASSPDGISNPVGVEVACANFTIEARKSSLVTP